MNKIDGLPGDPVFIDIELRTPEYEVEVEEGGLPSGPFPGLEVVDGEATIRMQIDLATGQIHGWDPALPAMSIHLKVADSGVFTLCRADGAEVSRIEYGYVPHSVVPGEYGDYVLLSIANGAVTNWPTIIPANVTAEFQSE